jgi:nucleotide-binding universal stress UspA family protein
VMLVEKIVDVAVEEQIDLIVMAPRPFAPIKRIFFVSTADRITRRAPCPVLSVHHEKQMTPLHEKIFGTMPRPVRGAL